MNITHLSLKNFRNHSEKTLEFGAGINLIYGQNAVGKTNIVESMYFAAFGKSPRAVKDKELILFGQNFCSSCIRVAKKHREYEIETHIDSFSKKRFSVNKIPIKKMSELIGVLSLVWFSPATLRLISGSPDERRRFMDISLCSQKRQYLYSLTRYNQILAQRNKTIKNTKNPDELKNLLPIWDEQLATEGAYITKSRYEFLQELSVIAAKNHVILSGEKEELKLEYESLVEYGELGEIASLLLVKLQNTRDADIRLGYTTTGAHRDDIKAVINGLDARKFASQGQVRTAALAICLGTAEAHERVLGEPPVVVLDDVLSELDASRREMVLGQFARFQTFVTTTDKVSGVENLFFVG